MSWQFEGINIMFCKHDWEIIVGPSNKIYMGSIVGQFYVIKCKKCSKIKTKHV